MTLGLQDFSGAITILAGICISIAVALIIDAITRRNEKKNGIVPSK